MGNVPTWVQLEMLRLYLLESDGGVPIQHLHTVRQHLRDPHVSEYELVECAKMLLLNDSYGEEDLDEDIDADWLSRISLDVTRRES
jgi:hypothetical protein